MGRVIGAWIAMTAAVAAQETGTKKAPTALNRVFYGQVVALKGRTITLFYDFEDPEQIKDFEEARPPRYLDTSGNRARIENGRLLLEGSTSIRHRMESRDAIRARFIACPGKLENVGAVITEPVLSDFYVVYNLFEHRFTTSDCMHIGAVGLREDEGAEDTSSGLVNWRDVFARDLRGRVDIGDDIRVEVSKERWKERFQAGKIKGKGTSKGKTKDMRNLKFGLFVHHSTATFDDLEITCTLSDEYLDLEDLRVDLDADVDEEIRAYAARGVDARQVASILAWPWLARSKRQAAAAALAARRDESILPLLLPALRARDATTRRLAIGVVEAITGTTFGYTADGAAPRRAEAIARIRARGKR